MIRSRLVAALALVCCSLVARPAHAAFYQACFELDDAGGHERYNVNFLQQGNGIMVSGVRGMSLVDPHGPAFGTLSRVPTAGEYGWKMALTVVFGNSYADYEPQMETIVFQFLPDGAINYKRW